MNNTEITNKQMTTLSDDLNKIINALLSDETHYNFTEIKIPDSLKQHVLSYDELEQAINNSSERESIVRSNIINHIFNKYQRITRDTIKLELFNLLMSPRFSEYKDEFSFIKVDVPFILNVIQTLLDKLLECDYNELFDPIPQLDVSYVKPFVQTIAIDHATLIKNIILSQFAHMEIECALIQTRQNAEGQVGGSPHIQQCNIGNCSYDELFQQTSNRMKDVVDIIPIFRTKDDMFKPLCEFLNDYVKHSHTYPGTILEHAKNFSEMVPILLCVDKMNSGNYAFFTKVIGYLKSSNTDFEIMDAKNPYEDIEENTVDEENPYEDENPYLDIDLDKPLPQPTVIYPSLDTQPTVTQYQPTVTYPTFDTQPSVVYPTLTQSRPHPQSQSRTSTFSIPSFLLYAFYIFIIVIICYYLYNLCRPYLQSKISDSVTATTNH